MTLRAEHTKFATDDDRSWVIEAMARLTAAGEGWINVQPALSDDDDFEAAPKAPGWFSSRSGAIPVATWTAPDTTRKGTTPGRLGIQHGAGMKVMAWLAEKGLAKPEGWRVLSDNPIRGVVIELPGDAEPAHVIDWLLQATARLCPHDVPDLWQAAVFDPGR